MHNAINDLSCYIVITDETWGESLNVPSWLIFSLPTLHPFRVSCPTDYVGSALCSLPLAHNASSWTHILQQQTVISPTHSKTQCQASSGIHVAVLALTGLEGPPTPRGVPLSAMAKSSPLSVLVRVQETLCRGNSTPVEFYYYGITCAGPTPSRRGFFFFKAFTAHPYDQFSTSKDTGFTVHCLHHRTQPLQYTVLHRTQPSQYTVL